MPVRKVPKSYRNVTGLIATDKSDELTAYESRLERYTQKLIGFNPNVVKYEEQPVTIHFTDKAGRPHKYIPDILVYYREDSTPARWWKTLLVEVKYRTTLFEEWSELKAKFLAGRHYAKEHDLDFSIITDQEVITPYLKNVIFLTDYRWRTINDTHTQLLLDAIKRLRKAHPESLLHHITDNRDVVAELIPALWQLIANYVIGVDLEQPLTMRSPIWFKPLRGRTEDVEAIHPICRGLGRQKRWRALRYHPPVES